MKPHKLIVNPRTGYTAIRNKVGKTIGVYTSLAEAMRLSKSHGIDWGLSLPDWLDAPAKGPSQQVPR